jgi:hypothetical protein
MKTILGLQCLEDMVMTELLTQLCEPEIKIFKIFKANSLLKLQPLYLYNHFPVKVMYFNSLLLNCAYGF